MPVFVGLFVALGLAGAAAWIVSPVPSQQRSKEGEP